MGFNPRAPCGARPSGDSPAEPLTCFNPRAPCGARPHGLLYTARNVSFQSTRPMRGATGTVDRGLKERPVSIHAPHAGRDTRPYTRRGFSDGFNPRAPCGARRDKRGGILLDLLVSIHAPHAGRDRRHRHVYHRRVRFNPRAPCGARPSYQIAIIRLLRFNPRAPCGARPTSSERLRVQVFVSIHAPHAGRDTRCHVETARVKSFNPRAPCGARQNLKKGIDIIAGFNPRAPCGARHTFLKNSNHNHGFNPRAPCGARLCTRILSIRSVWFQSTRPMRGATRRHMDT